MIRENTVIRLLILATCTTCLLFTAISGNQSRAATSVPARWQYAELQSFVGSAVFDLQQTSFSQSGPQRSILQDYVDGKYKLGNDKTFYSAFAKLGHDGWDLITTTVTVSDIGTTIKYLFKRPLL